MFWGNRGRLHDRDGIVRRYSSGRAWLICLLQFNGRRRPLLAPGRLTELFFLDEVTALAAGHRPCGECRHRDYQVFKKAWAESHPDVEISAAAIDATLHVDRLVRAGARRTYTARLGDLPDGAMVERADRPWLVYGGQLLAWSPGGYQDRHVELPATAVTVLTPRTTVAVLSAGYRPVVHPTAARRPSRRVRPRLPAGSIPPVA